MGFVTSLTTRPKTSTSTERNAGGRRGGRVHVALRLRTGQCHTDQAGRPMEVPLCVLLVRSPAFTNLLYTSNSSCFLRLFRNYDGETFFAPAREARSCEFLPARIREFCHSAIRL